MELKHGDGKLQMKFAGTFYGKVIESPKSTANGAAECELDTESRSGKIICNTVK